MLSTKTATFIIILVIMSASVVQFFFPLFSELPLKGYYRQSDPPNLKYFTWSRWFSQDFQQVFTTSLNDNAGLRKTLIGINNQYDYSLFGITHARGFLEGRKRYLFEEDYIHEYTGDYFIGKHTIDQKLSRLKNVMDSLRSYNIPLILVFEPGKASYYPEFIPDRFSPGKRTLSNYEYFIKKSEELGLPYLDLNRYFIRAKDTATYPLFPRYGMHWSMYGAHLAADTLSRYIAAASGKAMPAFKIHHLHHSGQSLGSDYDIGELLNLIFPLKQTQGVLPLVDFNAIPNGTMPGLVVADSYYITLVETYGKKMFGRQDYWYYNSSLYPHQNEVPAIKADKSGLQEKLKNYNVILLMVSEINLHCAFWNFADETFRAFHPDTDYSHLDSIENSIRNDREWFRFMVKKAREQNRPLEQLIREDAEYTFLANYEKLKGKRRQDTIRYLQFSIRSNPNWLANVTQKAKSWNIPVDSVMLLDAIYSYDQSKKKQ